MGKITKRKSLARFTQRGQNYLYQEAYFYYRQNVYLNHRDYYYSDKIQIWVKQQLTPSTHYHWLSYDDDQVDAVPVEERKEDENGHTFMLGDFGFGKTPEVSAGGFFGQMMAALQRHLGPHGFESHDSAATY